MLVEDRCPYCGVRVSDPPPGEIQVVGSRICGRVRVSRNVERRGALIGGRPGVEDAYEYKKMRAGHVLLALALAGDVGEQRECLVAIAHAAEVQWSASDVGAVSRRKRLDAVCGVGTEQPVWQLLFVGK